LLVDSDNSIAAYGLGNNSFNLKRHEDAINLWEKATATKYLFILAKVGLSSYGDARNNLNEVLQLKSMHVGAIDLLDKFSDQVSI